MQTTSIPVNNPAQFSTLPGPLRTFASTLREAVALEQNPQLGARLSQAIGQMDLRNPGILRANKIDLAKAQDYLTTQFPETISRYKVEIEVSQDQKQYAVSSTISRPSKLNSFMPGLNKTSEDKIQGKFLSVDNAESNATMIQSATSGLQKFVEGHQEYLEAQMEIAQPIVDNMINQVKEKALSGNISSSSSGSKINSSAVNKRVDEVNRVRQAMIHDSDNGGKNALKAYDLLEKSAQAELQLPMQMYMFQRLNELQAELS